MCYTLTYGPLSACHTHMHTQRSATCGSLKESRGSVLMLQGFIHCHTRTFHTLFAGSQVTRTARCTLVWGCSQHFFIFEKLEVSINCQVITTQLKNGSWRWVPFNREGQKNKNKQQGKSRRWMRSRRRFYDDGAQWEVKGLCKMVSGDSDISVV